MCGELKFISDGMYGQTFVTVQKWFGSEKYFFTFSAFSDGTLTFAKRLKISRIEYREGDSHMYLMGGPGEVVTVEIINGTEVAA